MREMESINDEGIVCYRNKLDPHPDFFSYHDDIRERYLKNPEEAEADKVYRDIDDFYEELGYECAPRRFAKLTHSFEQKFGDDIYVQPEFRMLNVVALAVVSISSFIDNVRLFTCSGTVIETTGRSAVILTSACLVAVPEKDDFRKAAENVKINVRFMDGISCAARLLGYCLHYNVAFVVVEKEDQVSLPLRGEVIESLPDVVFALGRHYVTREFMAARGKVIMNCNRFDCAELMFSSCKITKCGIGGPLVNSCGDLVGVNFYDENNTPYLPSFLVSRCWEHIRYFGHVLHLNFGWVIRPFRTLKFQEWWVRQHYMIKESSSLLDDGLLVEEVSRESLAYKCGVLKGDIILEIFGEPVVTCPVPKYAALLLDKSKTISEENINEVGVRILRENFHSEVKTESRKRSRSVASSEIADLKPSYPLFIHWAEPSSRCFNRWPLPQPKWILLPRNHPRVTSLCPGLKLWNLREMSHSDEISFKEM